MFPHLVGNSIIQEGDSSVGHGFKSWSELSDLKWGWSEVEILFGDCKWDFSYIHENHIICKNYQNPPALILPSGSIFLSYFNFCRRLLSWILVFNKISDCPVDS